MPPGRFTRARAQEPKNPSKSQPAPAWRTGKQFAAQLGQVVGVEWSGRALRDGLASLARTHRVAIVLDRRIDPSAELNLRLADITLREAIEQIAADRQAGAAFLPSLAYIGPPPSAAALRTLTALRGDELRRLPKDVQRRLVRARAWGWPDLAEPRRLLKELASEGELRLTGLELVPHDLWAEAALPPLSLVERLTLVAIQFDLTFELRGGGAEAALVPLPERVVIERSYPGRGQAAALAQRWSNLAPDVEIAVADDQVVVRGRVEDHERLTRPASAPAAPRKGGEQVYTLTFRDVPLGRVLDKLAAELKLDIQVDQPALEKAGLSLDALVSVSVRDATLDGLFDAALQSTGLTFRRTDRKVEIFPAEM